MKHFPDLPPNTTFLQNLGEICCSWNFRLTAYKTRLLAFDESFGQVSQLRECEPGPGLSFFPHSTQQQNGCRLIKNEAVGGVYYTLLCDPGRRCYYYHQGYIVVGGFTPSCNSWMTKGIPVRSSNWLFWLEQEHPG